MANPCKPADRLLGASKPGALNEHRHDALLSSCYTSANSPSTASCGKTRIVISRKIGAVAVIMVQKTLPALVVNGKDVLLLGLAWRGQRGLAFGLASNWCEQRAVFYADICLLDQQSTIMV